MKLIVVDHGFKMIHSHGVLSDVMVPIDDRTWHGIRENDRSQVIEINFVKSAENDSDIMTGDQQGQHFMYAKSKLVYTVQNMNEKKYIEDEESGKILES